MIFKRVLIYLPYGRIIRDSLSLLIQPRTACSRPCCRRFYSHKSGARYGLVSSFNFDRGFRFSKATSHTNAFCTRESAMIFLNSSRKSPRSALEIICEPLSCKCRAHKFNSAVLVSGVSFQKSEH